jgi:hypothetical protein
MSVSKLLNRLPTFEKSILSDFKKANDALSVSREISVRITSLTSSFYKDKSQDTLKSEKILILDVSKETLRENYFKEMNEIVKMESTRKIEEVVEKEPIKLSVEKEPIKLSVEKEPIKLSVEKGSEIELEKEFKKSTFSTPENPKRVKIINSLCREVNEDGGVVGTWIFNPVSLSIIGKFVEGADSLFPLTKEEKNDAVLKKYTLDKSLDRSLTESLNDDGLSINEEIKTFVVSVNEFIALEKLKRANAIDLANIKNVGLKIGVPEDKALYMIDSYKALKDRYIQAYNKL